MELKSPGEYGDGGYAQSSNGVSYFLDDFL